MALHAGSALQIVTYDVAVGIHPLGSLQPFGGAEDRDAGDLIRRGDMHRTAVARDEEVEPGDLGAEPGDGRFSRQVFQVFYTFFSDHPLDIRSDISLTRPSENDDIEAIGQCSGDFGELLGIPAFGAAVGGPRVYAQCGAGILRFGPIELQGSRHVFSAGDAVDEGLVALDMMER